MPSFYKRVIMFFLQSLFYLIFEPIKLNKSKVFLAGLIIYFVWSTIVTVLNLVWNVPQWLAYIGICINLLSISWLSMLYFNIRGFNFRLFAVLLSMWYSMAWIYIDVTMLSPTFSAKAIGFTIDVIMLLMTNTFLLFPKIVFENGVLNMHDIDFTLSLQPNFKMK
jgi:hypothetical protein